MTKFSRWLLTAIGLFVFIPSIPAADARAELQELVGRVRAKLQKGEKTEEALADEIKTYDTLLEEHKGEKTQEVAEILLMKAILYSDILGKYDQAKEILEKVKTDFGESARRQSAFEHVDIMQRQSGTTDEMLMAAEKMNATLVPGYPLPDFEEKDLNGKPMSLSALKGKIVLVDCWATYCKPCIASIPQLVKLYQQYHAKGFEIVGISVDEERDKDKVLTFLKANNVPWAQYFDGKGWQNKLSTKYGVLALPATYLLDRQGKIIGKNVDPEELEKLLPSLLP